MTTAAQNIFTIGDRVVRKQGKDRRVGSVVALDTRCSHGYHRHCPDACSHDVFRVKVHWDRKYVLDDGSVSWVRPQALQETDRVRQLDRAESS